MAFAVFGPMPSTFVSSFGLALRMVSMVLKWASRALAVLGPTWGMPVRNHSRRAWDGVLARRAGRGLGA